MCAARVEANCKRVLITRAEEAQGWVSPSLSPDQDEPGWWDSPTKGDTYGDH